MISLKEELSLIFTLTKSAMMARYRKTFSGFLWVIFSPIILFSAQSIAFKTILKLEIDRHYLFLVSGLIPWIFISTTLNMTTSIFEAKQSILKNIKVNPFNFVASSVIDNFVNFIFAFCIIAPPIIYKDGINPEGLLFLPLGILNLLIGLSLLNSILAIIHIFFRDTVYVVNFVVNIAFFVTPIFFPKKFFPPEFLWTLKYNPFYILVEPFRSSLYKFNLEHAIQSQLNGLILSSIFAFILYFIWRRYKNDFYLKL